MVNYKLVHCTVAVRVYITCLYIIYKGNFHETCIAFITKPNFTKNKFKILKYQLKYHLSNFEANITFATFHKTFVP